MTHKLWMCPRPSGDDGASPAVRGVLFSICGELYPARLDACCTGPLDNAVPSFTLIKAIRAKASRFAAVISRHSLDMRETVLIGDTMEIAYAEAQPRAGMPFPNPHAPTRCSFCRSNPQAPARGAGPQ